MKTETQGLIGLIVGTEGKDGTVIRKGTLLNRVVEIPGKEILGREILGRGATEMMMSLLPQENHGAMKKTSNPGSHGTEKMRPVILLVTAKTGIHPIAHTLISAVAIPKRDQVLQKIILVMKGPRMARHMTLTQKPLMKAPTTTVVLDAFLELQLHLSIQEIRWISELLKKLLLVTTLQNKRSLW